MRISWRPGFWMFPGNCIYLFMFAQRSDCMRQRLEEAELPDWKSHLDVFFWIPKAAEEGRGRKEESVRMQNDADKIGLARSNIWKHYSSLMCVYFGAKRGNSSLFLEARITKEAKREKAMRPEKKLGKQNRKFGGRFVSKPKPKPKMNRGSAPPSLASARLPCGKLRIRGYRWLCSGDPLQGRFWSELFPQRQQEVSSAAVCLLPCHVCSRLSLHALVFFLSFLPVLSLFPDFCRFQIIIQFLFPPF